MEGRQRAGPVQVMAVEGVAAAGGWACQLRVRARLVWPARFLWRRLAGSLLRSLPPSLSHSHSHSLSHTHTPSLFPRLSVSPAVRLCL